jgi:hypothetical protein
MRQRDEDMIATAWSVSTHMNCKGANQTPAVLPLYGEAVQWRAMA